MKKLLFSLIALTATVAAGAQTSPLDVVPNKKGEHIDSKCYDAEGNLRATMRYEIADYSSGAATGDELKIVFVMTDADGQMIDHGTIYAIYDGEDLRLSMSNRPETSGVANYLSLNTKLMNDFLDYPDPFPSDDPLSNPGPFTMDPANYTIKTGEHGRDFIKVSVSQRELAGREKVTTPAGEFDASKVTFALEVYDHDTRHRETYHGTEWFAAGEGIVRTEICDRDGNLVDFSEITDTYTRM